MNATRRHPCGLRDWSAIDRAALPRSDSGRRRDSIRPAHVRLEISAGAVCSTPEFIQSAIRGQNGGLPKMHVLASPPMNAGARQRLAGWEAKKPYCAPELPGRWLVEDSIRD